jgi:hypothetical protein
MNQMHHANPEEPLSIKVGTWIREKGYGLANERGVAIDVLRESSSLGILERLPSQPLFKRLFTRPRRTFLGTIRFDNNSDRANEANWYFEARGSEHTEKIRRLIDEIEQKFKVAVTTRLVQVEPAAERFPDDSGLV